MFFSYELTKLAASVFGGRPFHIFSENVLFEDNVEWMNDDDDDDDAQIVASTAAMNPIFCKHK